MYDSNQQILFTSSEPSLAVIYDAKTGLHSVYKIRKALAEECQIVCGNNDTTPSIYNHSTSASPLNIGNNISQNKSCTNKGHLSIFGKLHNYNSMNFILKIKITCLFLRSTKSTIKYGFRSITQSI